MDSSQVRMAVPDNSRPLCDLALEQVEQVHCGQRSGDQKESVEIIEKEAANTGPLFYERKYHDVLFS